MADFVMLKSDVQLFPKRIKSQVMLTETAQAAAHQTPSIGSMWKETDLRINVSKKKKHP